MAANVAAILAMSYGYPDALCLLINIPPSCYLLLMALTAAEHFNLRNVIPGNPGKLANRPLYELQP